MTNQRSERKPEVSDKLRRSSPSRRRFLRTAAAAAGVTAVGTTAGQESETEPDIVLGGDTAGWEGREPAALEGETNPTLTLEEGATYVLEWENVDGQPHNFAVEDADGNALVETDVISERGETQVVEFEATRAMSEYYCEVHPISMRGEIALGEGPAEDDEPVEDGVVVEGFFDEGPTVGVATVADGMTAPTDFAMADDGRMYVCDQTGELWLVADGERREEPVLDLSDRMVAVSEEFAGSYADPESAYDERGLLGVELHPEFVENGRLFLHYSAPPNEETPEGWSHVEVVSEFETVENGTVNPDSERVLMEFQSPQYNHDAGPMAFGPDGYLYVPMGDGGGANDEMYGHVEDWYEENIGGNGQDTSQNLLGGIHRIDVDGEPSTGDGDEDADGEAARPYAVPEDNPLVGEEGHLDEYYAWGFRNPFGISFDSEGRLFVADAGQALFEEVDLVEAGGNYGWNVREGTHCFSTENPGDPPADCPERTPDDVRGGEELIDPIVEYPHSYRGRSEGIVVAGGHVYEDDDIEALAGGYVFGDWTSDVARAEPDGRVFVAFEPDGEAGVEAAAETENETAQGAGDDVEPGQTVPRNELWDMQELVFAGSEDGSLGRFVRQFGQGTDGEVYVLVNQRGVPEGDTGAVLELVPPDEGEELGTPETAAETPTADVEGTPTPDDEDTPGETPAETPETPAESPTPEDTPTPAETPAPDETPTPNQTATPDETPADTPDTNETATPTDTPTPDGTPTPEE